MNFGKYNSVMTIVKTCAGMGDLWELRPTLEMVTSTQSSGIITDFCLLLLKGLDKITKCEAEEHQVSGQCQDNQLAIQSKVQASCPSEDSWTEVLNLKV